MRIAKVKGESQSKISSLFKSKSAAVAASKDSSEHTKKKLHTLQEPLSTDATSDAFKVFDDMKSLPKTDGETNEHQQILQENKDKVLEELKSFDLNLKV